MLVFNRNNVKHFTYHWFWGLQCHEAEQRDHLTCPEDDSVIKAMIEKQVKIDRYALFFKFFYWVFNIDGYASNFYKLAAAAVTQLNEQEQLMKDINELVPMPIRALGRGMNSLWNRVWARKSPETTNSETNSHESEPVIIVIEMIQKDLKLLDLSVSNGTRLPYIKIKKAYHKRALIVHSDRGGSDDDFKVMQAAFVRLTRMAFPEAGGSAECETVMNERLAELLRKVNRGLAMAEASLAAKEESDKRIALIKAEIRSIKEVIVEDTPLITKMDEQEKRIDALTQVVQDLLTTTQQYESLARSEKHDSQISSEGIKFFGDRNSTVQGPYLVTEKTFECESK